MDNFFNKIGIPDKIAGIVLNAEKKAKAVFGETERISEYNQAKVLKAFANAKLSDRHFNFSTGYGYGDQGRDVLEQIYAEIFECEDALVRHNIISGTHALTVAFFGILRPGDTLLSVTGRPYDTLEEVIGIRGENNGSLKDFNINYKEIPLKNGKPDIEAIKYSLDTNVKAVLIQRSKGYERRASLSSEEIGEITAEIKKINKDTAVIVDNCYGEFVGLREPTAYGADIACGSLIKNPGGGLALSGGYIAGKKKYVELCAMRLTSPGLGKETGASLGLTRSMIQGLYFAPFVVKEALKTAVLCAHIFDGLGYKVNPKPDEKRDCIIQTVEFGDKDAVIAFCKGIQKGAPVDSHVSPEPWDMPGYADPVIMAAGAFVQGASIELSADAPIKPPYTAYMQGSLSYCYGKAGLALALNEILSPDGA
jgi:cystathionine beta-lyase family protein involved in aluminum resistance